jgi:hypothetical protein
MATRTTEVLAPSLVVTEFGDAILQIGRGMRADDLHATRYYRIVRTAARILALRDSDNNHTAVWIRARAAAHVIGLRCVGAKSIG